MSSLGSTLFRYWRVSRLLCKTYLLLNGIRLGLWGLRFPCLQSWVVRLAHRPGSVAAAPSSQGWRSVVWAIEQATRYSPGQAKCLARAFTAEILLKRRGYQPKLHFGVLKSPAESFQAHAWIELQGKTVLGHLPNLTEYTILPKVGVN